jgi:hypothetical protein
MGASLGLLGAKALALNLPNVDRYEAVMRPVVAHFHDTALENVNNALPTGHLKNVFRSWVLSLVPPSLFALHFRHQFDVEDELLRGLLAD